MKIFQTGQNELESLLEKARLESKKLMEAVQNVKITENDQKKVTEQREREVLEYSEHIQKALQHHQTKILGELKQLSLSKQTTLSRQVVELNSAVKEIESVVHQITSIQKHESPLGILLMKKRLKLFLNSFSEKKIISKTRNWQRNSNISKPRF